MSTQQFSVEEVSNSYWRVVFDNGPINLIDVDTVEELASIIQRIEQAPDLTVVVFDSAHPDYFMAHWDLKADRARVAAARPGPTGLHPYLDNFVRLSRVPAVTTKAQCCIAPMALRLPAGSLPFGISKKARRLSLPISKK